MPRHSVVYDKDLKETMEWKILYGRYNAPNVRIYREIFPTFLEFYTWSMANGFTFETRLERIDPTKPFTPDNLMWVIPEQKNRSLSANEQYDFVDRWNKAVNRLRIHFGLEPFEIKESKNDETLLQIHP